MALATQPTGKIGFEREVKIATPEGIYGSDSVKASIYIPFPVDFDQEASTEAAAVTAFLQGKAIVYNELGLGYKLDDSGIVVEVFKQAFPGTVVESTQAQRTETQAPRSEPQTQSSGGGGMKINYLLKTAPSPDFLPDSCPKCGGTEVKDQRKFLPTYGGEGNPKSPHFKCSNADCGAGFWPPK